MSNLILDYKAIGLNPRWEDILIEIIDFELGLDPSPRMGAILKYRCEGYTIVETANKTGHSVRTLNRIFDNIRHNKAKQHENS